MILAEPLSVVAQVADAFNKPRPSLEVTTSAQRLDPSTGRQTPRHSPQATHATSAPATVAGPRSTLRPQHKGKRCVDLADEALTCHFWSCGVAPFTTVS